MTVSHTRTRSARVLPIALVAVGLTILAQAGETLASRVVAPATASATTVAHHDESLSFEERIRYQRAIEQVYWRNRIWPAENPGTKPALEAVLSEAQIRERVETYLQKSAALEIHWQRPLTGAQLQAELNRMVRESRKPDLLRELFAALDNDPFLAAECLARPALAKRLTNNWFTRDERFHGALRSQAETSLAAHRHDATRMGELGGSYVEIEWRLAEEDSAITGPETDTEGHVVIELDTEEWRERIEQLARAFDIETASGEVETPSALLERIPLGRLSPLTEENRRFAVTSVLLKEPGRLRIATVTWGKRSFDTWWEKEGRKGVGSYRSPGSVSPPSGGYELRSPLANGCTLDTWTEPWWAPRGRYAHTAIWTGTEMIIWGGLAHPPDRLNSGGRYDPATDTWTKSSMGPGLPHARASHTAVWTGSEMIVWGGSDYISSSQGKEYFNSGGRYDPVTDSWTSTSTGPGVPSARDSHSAVWTGTEMIVWSGEEDYEVYTDTGGRYDPVTDTWTVTSNGAGKPTGRENHSALWIGTEMIVWGGQVADVELDTGGRYDPATDTWTATSTGFGVPRARTRHSAVWTGDEMIVWGGEAGGSTATGGRYDPVGDSWTATSQSGTPAGGTGYDAVWTGSRMIVWGNPDGGLYDPVTDSWAPVAARPGPPPTHRNPLVWTGTEMIAWGEASGDDNPSAGGRYDPATDSWVPTTTQVPEERIWHEAVWTGTEMIVWGGYNAFDVVLPGGRYDPATNDWSTTSPGSGLQLGRYEHTVVWSGTEMIVWGGMDYYGSVIYRTGGRYDPTTDNWTPTTLQDAPLGRSGHTAVWTGSRVIVWGGWSGDYQSTGGQYDPATDSWTEIATYPGNSYYTAVWTGSQMIVWSYAGGGRYDPRANSWQTIAGAGAPVQQRFHSAVWSGSEMIVWGGRGYMNSVPANTGARYDPVTNSWTPTSTAFGVPAPRSLHVAVWTGTEMIVWGGYDGDGRLNTGGRYNPVTDSWTATPMSAGVPEHRIYHSAIWTGTEMIVWGGASDINLLNGGGMYCACDGDTVDIWYVDMDGDGYGADSSAIPSCVPLPGYVAVGGDCDDRFASCTTDCTDADSDGWSVCAPDCDDSNPYCATDCQDSDGDGFCITHDCDDGTVDCAIDCGDQDVDGFRDCDADCDDLNFRCNLDCTDADDDDYCVTTDCDDHNPNCTSICTDADGDDYCITTDCDDTIASCTTDCTTDADGDFAPECRDNCPGIYNPFQGDADSDGWGEASGCDCDGTNPDTYPDAPETNDGLDNQCPDDAGYGIVDEISGVCGFHGEGDKNEFSWTAQVGATGYEVARSGDAHFAADCVVDMTAGTHWIDLGVVPGGDCFHYLVRATQPHTGSWGASSSGDEREPVCP